jgi:hypothetical protein
VWIDAMNVFARAALLMAVAASSPLGLSAQQWTCYTIHPGDTVARAAIRITGSAQTRYEPWFQIVDPARSGFVTKAQYDHIRPGWRACILSASVMTTPHGMAATRAGFALDPLWVAVLLMLVIPCAGYAADRYVQERQAVIRVMTRFGEAFVREFERPLIESRAPARAVRSRLHFRPHQGQVEVLLAPADEKSYPNLSDHRKNVAYDTQRVLQALRNPSFVSGAPHQRGEWVVIPFQLKAREKQEGAS